MCHNITLLLSHGGGDLNVYHLTFCLCRAGMFIFLFLSGYGLYFSFLKNGLAGYWEKKINKIYFPAVLAQSIGSGVYAVLMQRIPNRAILFDDIFVRTVQSEFNPFIWYLQYLLIWYILFYAVYRLFDRRFYRVIAWIFLGLFMWFFTGEIFFGLANEYCLAFPLGIVWALISNKEFGFWRKFGEESRKKYLLIIGAVSTIAVVVCVSVNYNMWTAENVFFGRRINFWLFTGITNALYLIICISVSLVLGIIFRVIDQKSLLEKFGDVSYYVYLLHGAFIITPLTVIGKYRMIILFVGVTAMSCMICLYLRLEKRMSG